MPNLSPSLPPLVTVMSASYDALRLLRLLHSLSRCWELFTNLKDMSLTQDFINNKISAKANRQLQCPVSIMTGYLPSWLQQIATIWLVAEDKLTHPIDAVV